MVNDTTRLLGLDGLAVVGVADGGDGPVVHLVTADEQARCCPDCGVRARRSVQLANQTVTEVRRRVTIAQRGRRGRKGNREWELRNRLTRAAARMPGEHVDALLDELACLPKAIGEPITTAWNAKEDLLDLLATARTHPNREQTRDLLHQFYRRCADTHIPELHRLATTVETWWPQIHAFIRTGITNAGSEGTNRVIKTIARDAYGFRNPANQRPRTRTGTTRKARGHLNPR